jgi:hypothetical protein
LAAGIGSVGGLVRSHRLRNSRSLIEAIQVSTAICKSAIWVPFSRVTLDDAAAEHVCAADEHAAEMIGLALHRAA